MKREQGRDEAPTAAALPKLITLGAFAAERENSFRIPVAAAEETHVTTVIGGASITPGALPAGRGEIRLTLPEMRAGTLLYGALTLHTARGARAIYVTGTAEADAPQRQKAAIAKALPVVLRGERLTIGTHDILAFFYEDAGHADGVDVDAYVFRLYAGGWARGDADLIFFGNPTADDGSIRVEKDARIGAHIDVAKVTAAVERLVVCFSVYDDGRGMDFSHVRAPAVILCAGGTEKYRFPLDALHREKTVNAAELYRRGGAWKLKLVGAGYEAGLARLCADYGLHVE